MFETDYLRLYLRGMYSANMPSTSDVTWSQQHGQYERYGFKREAWLTQLKAGQNPFDSATLAGLRDE